MTKEETIKKAREMGLEVSFTECNINLVRIRTIGTYEFVVLDFQDKPNEPSIFSCYINPGSVLFEFIK